MAVCWAKDNLCHLCHKKKSGSFKLERAEEPVKLQILIREIWGRVSRVCCSHRCPGDGDPVNHTWRVEVLTRVSQTDSPASPGGSVNTRIAAAPPNTPNRVSDPVGQGWPLRVCIFFKLKYS